MDQIADKTCVEVTFYHLPVYDEHTSLAGCILTANIKIHLYLTHIYTYTTKNSLAKAEQTAEFLWKTFIPATLTTSLLKNAPGRWMLLLAANQLPIF